MSEKQDLTENSTCDKCVCKIRQSEEKLGETKVLITKVNYCLWVALNRFTCCNKKILLTHFPNTAAGS